MSNELAAVKSFFASTQIHLSDMWLESCLNWCKSETLGSHYTPKELQSKVYEQWLLLDLRDVEIPALPPNLSTKQKYTLTGNFCLQIMQIIDISKPKLWQLQKIRNSAPLTRGTVQDSEVVGTGKRVLQLTLTDGVQEVEGFEYKPVTSLGLNLPPGTKIRLMGPVAVRRGRLLLEQQNVKVLGGECEELLVVNHPENVLARALKLPENPNPGVIEERLLTVEVEEKNEGYVANNTLKIDRKKIGGEIKPPQPQAPPPQAVEDEDMAREIEFLMEAEAEFNPPTRTSDFDVMTTFDSNNFGATSTQVSKKLNLSLDDDDDDIFDNIDIDAHLDKIDEGQVEAVPKPAVISIAKLTDLQNNITKGTFKVKAKFKSVVEKLTFVEEEYKLVIKIEDNSGELVVKVHSDVVSQLAECSPAEIMSLKSNILGKDEAAVEKMMKAIMRVKDKLLELDNVLTVQVSRNEVPVVTNIS